jgi:hypothetical protein
MHACITTKSKMKGQHLVCEDGELRRAARASHAPLSEVAHQPDALRTCVTMQSMHLLTSRSQHMALVPKAQKTFRHAQMRHESACTCARRLTLSGTGSTIWLMGTHACRRLVAVQHGLRECCFYMWMPNFEGVCTPKPTRPHRLLDKRPPDGQTARRPDPEAPLDTSRSTSMLGV